MQFTVALLGSWMMAICLARPTGSSQGARYYDKQVNVFNSEGDLPQLAYADIAASRGESLICLCTEDGTVVMCTPTGSSAPLLDRRVIDKIAKVDDEGIWAAFAGLAGDGRALIRVARRICAGHRLQFNAPPTLRYLTKAIADTQHEATLSGSERPYGVNLLIVGFDQGADVPQMFLSKASGHMTQWRAVSIGKNADKALAHLESRLVTNAAERLVRRPATALEAAELALDIFRQQDMASSFTAEVEVDDDDDKDAPQEKEKDKTKDKSKSKSKSKEKEARRCDLYQLRRDVQGVPLLSMVTSVETVSDLDNSWRVVPAINKINGLSGGFVPRGHRPRQSSLSVKESESGSGSVGESQISENSLLLSGRARRGLRAVAQRLKGETSLVTVTCGLGNLTEEDGVAADSFVENLKDVLSARGLVQVRFPKVDKRKECQILGASMASRIGGELVQVVGHTALFYKQDASAIIEDLLKKELEKRVS